MAIRSEKRDGGGLRLDEIERFARSVARQEWEHDKRLTDQQEELKLTYIDWLTSKFPHVVSAPFAARHLRLWEWLDALTPGVRPRARVEPWPRGGAKSSTAELGCVWIGKKLSRRFLLYVCETQDQADRHVQAIGTLFERDGVERSLNKYGSSRGWRRNQLRTAAGFNVEALGLDVASRGIKLDEFRPDIVVFDDVDSQDDSPRVIANKTRAITSAIIPAGSADVAYLFIQNLIHEESIVTQLVEGRADFLHDREPAVVEPAVIGLEFESYDRGDGAKVFRITKGEATWAGQDLATCESQINDWGPRTFLREAQHEVKGADGYFFDISKIEIVSQLPSGIFFKYCRAWDLAATEGAGDYTVGVLMAIAPNGVTYVVDVVRGQWASNNMRSAVFAAAQDDDAGRADVLIHLPQDPGQAGKDQAAQMTGMLTGFRLKTSPVSGKKATRARGWADKVNSGNVRLIEADWNDAFLREHRKFREDEEHEFDDQVDASADAYNELDAPAREWDL